MGSAWLLSAQVVVGLSLSHRPSFSPYLGLGARSRPASRLGSVVRPLAPKTRDWFWRHSLQAVDPIQDPTVQI
jgi:hypothetical protein